MSQITGSLLQETLLVPQEGGGRGISHSKALGPVQIIWVIIVSCAEVKMLANMHACVCDVSDGRRAVRTLAREPTLPWILPGRVCFLRQRLRQTCEAPHHHNVTRCSHTRSFPRRCVQIRNKNSKNTKFQTPS